MKLVTQDDKQETKVFTTHIKSSAGKQQQFRIVIEGGPRFYLEPSDKDGVLHKSAYKLFYLNKLNLTRRVMSSSSNQDENSAKDKDKQDNSDTHVSSNYKFIENENFHTNSAILATTTIETTTMTTTTSPPQTHDEEVIVIDDDDDDDHMVNNDNGDNGDDDNELKSLNFQTSALFC